MKKTMVGFIVIGIFIAYIVFYKFSKQETIILLNDNIYSPIISGISQSGEKDDEGRYYEDMQENQKDYVNYWVQASKAIALLKETKGGVERSRRNS